MIRTTRTGRLAVVATLVCSMIALDAHAQGQGRGPAVRAANAPDLPDAARAQGVGQPFRVEGVDFEGTPQNLELERFEVFAPDARIEINDGAGGVRVLPAPSNAWFKGYVAGLDGSVVVLNVRAGGEVRGVVTSADGHFVLGVPQQSGGGGLRAFRAPDRGKPFACGVEGAALDIGNNVAPGGGGGDAAPPVAGNTVANTARIAVDTDYEYYAQFGNETDAIDYAGDLIAYSSATYEAELSTSMLISSLRLWTGGASSDPWTATGCDTFLSQFESYWRSNETANDRTVAHMLSGKSTGCGIAYVGVLCNDFYGFGVSGGLDGSFDYNSPSVIWDIVVVAHELGHNFNSPHTHCYAGIGGSNSAVDQCYGSEGGCHAGSTSLPSGCAGSGQGCGTIMSYCHLLSGGMSNITFTLGQGHPYGVSPERVPARMYDHVQAQAAAYPGCLDYVAQGPRLTVQTAGSGGGLVLADQGGISCPNDCTETYAEGTVVTLQAIPANMSAFVGWSGDADCVDGVVTLNADVTCTATFDTTCGNGVIDAGEQCDGADIGAATCGGCAGTPTCTAQCQLDTGACTNGICDAGETCGSCPEDCTGAGAACGDGVCNAGDGENCTTCPQDCNGRTGGKPARRFCCGFDVAYAVGCDGQCGACDTGTATTCCGDAVCGGSESSLTCERDCGAPALCGDGTCDPGEGICDCPADCGAPAAEACGDGFDNDCDGDVDCDDADCSGAPECQIQCLPSGSACNAAEDCCSGSCRGKRGQKRCK